MRCFFFKNEIILNANYKVDKQKDNKYVYDNNGNMIYVNTEEVKLNGQTVEKAQEKKMLWDEENRLGAIDINGYVSNYTYDAGGERVTKLSGGGQGIFVNSVFSGGKTSTTDFTLYVNPYLVAQNGGRYTKHIYIGSQRIVSKLGDFDSYGADPRRVEKAGESFSGVKVNYDSKYKKSLEVVKANYDTFEVPYYGLDNNDYVNGLGFCCNPSGESVSGGGSSNPTGKLMAGKNDNAELQQFYYHPDHLGSSSYITNLDGEVVQHVEYVPFGEVFLEEKNAKWNTPYLFTSKELDRETGLYYFGARYYDPKISVWISVDKPLLDGTYLNFEHDGGVLNSFNLASYAYCRLNPATMFDPDGNQYNHSVILSPYSRPLTNYGVEIKGQRVLTNYYKFSESAAHLLSLVSGVSEKDIKNTLVDFSKYGRGGSSLTTGSSPQSGTITHYYSDNTNNDETNGAAFNAFFERNAHEVGHLPQLENGNVSHIAKSLLEYGQNLLHGEHWHDGTYSKKESAASFGNENFERFNKYLDENHGRDTLQNLFEDTSNSQQYIIGKIDQWWGDYKAKGN